MSSNRIPRVGIGGPVGSGKTMLIEQIVPRLSAKGYKAGIISNDVVSKEDAERMRRNLATERGLLSEELVIGVATGGMSSYCRQRRSIDKSFCSRRNGIKTQLFRFNLD
jgi:urease accessory protein